MESRVQRGLGQPREEESSAGVFVLGEGAFQTLLHTAPTSRD